MHAHAHAQPVAVQQPHLNRAQWAEKRSHSRVVAYGAAGQWQEYQDAQGRIYFYNLGTGVTTWQRPRGFHSQQSTVSNI